MEDETITIGGKYVPLNASAIVDTLESKPGLIEKFCCKVCGKSCPTQTLALFHESKHVMPTDNISFEYAPDMAYPTEVKILMSDGKRLCYILNNNLKKILT